MLLYPKGIEFDFLIKSEMIIKFAILFLKHHNIGGFGKQKSGRLQNESEKNRMEEHSLYSNNNSHACVN